MWAAQSLFGFLPALTFLTLWTFGGDQRRRGEGVAEPAMSLGQGQAAWLEPSLPTRLPLGQQKRIRASRLHTTVFAKSGCKSLVKIHLAAKSSNRGRKSH